MPSAVRASLGGDRHHLPAPGESWPVSDGEVHPILVAGNGRLSLLRK